MLEWTLKNASAQLSSPLGDDEVVNALSLRFNFECYDIKNE